MYFLFYPYDLTFTIFAIQKKYYLPSLTTSVVDKTGMGVVVRNRTSRPADMELVGRLAYAFGTGEVRSASLSPVLTPALERRQNSIIAAAILEPTTRTQLTAISVVYSPELALPRD